MGRLLLAACFYLIASGVSAQNFEIAALNDSYKGIVGEIIQVPIKIKNTFDKPVTLILKRVETQIGSTQKNFFCPNNNCQEQHSDSYTIRLEPGQTLENFSIGLEAGLTEGFSSAKYQVYNKTNPAEISHLDLNFVVEAKHEKRNIYSSQFITIHDLYPNPLISSAKIDYVIHKENIKAKIVIHNILGTPLSVYDLLTGHSTVKIDAYALNTGIYFYTLYINNEGVMTRKLMVKK